MNLEAFEGHEYLYFSKKQEQSVRFGPWKGFRKSPDRALELYLVEEDTFTQRNLASHYPGIVERIESIMETEHLPHEWYWNPWEDAADFKRKQQRADSSNNQLPSFRPNGLDRLPWEKQE